MFRIESLHTTGQRMDGERIDPRHWNRPDESVVNPFRVAKGDLRLTFADNGRGKRIAHAEAKDQTCLAWLIEHEVVPPHAHYYALAFLELRHAFLSPVAFRSNSVVLEHLFGSPVSAGKAQKLYDYVCKEITYRRVRGILWACEAQPSGPNVDRLKAHRAAYRDVFEAMVKAIDEQRVRVRKEEEAAG